MAKSKLQVASRKRRSSVMPSLEANHRAVKRGAKLQDERIGAAERIARRIEWWRRRLSPQLPHIDLHDLDLIIAAMLRTPKERMQVMFLKRREDGSYVF